MDNKNIGILDPEGKHHNPLTDKPYSDEYKKLAKFWSALPVYKQAEKIIKDIQDHQVILATSQTGSGKTVLVPKFALHTFNYNARIAITLPKQIITKSAAEFAALTLDVQLGEEIGYQYRGAPSNANSDKTKLLYATDGTIIARLMNDPKLSEYDCVIMDEIHERSTNIDFLIYLLRETLKLRPEFKLIFMSATINSEIFRNYFQDFKYKEIELVGERKFPIESHFSHDPLSYNEALDKGFEVLIKIMKEDKINVNTNKAHDIIFFLTSQNDAVNMCKRLTEYIVNEKQSKCQITCDGDVYCVEVYSGMKDEMKVLAQDKIKYKEGTNYTRKVVMATNVAESSLTIDGIKYVIDLGYELNGSYDPELRARRLERELITQASAKQRMGRAGRTEEGICYHMYTQNEFEQKMIKYPLPDIKISDISSECLKLMGNETINDVKTLIETLTHFIEPPQEAYITSAVNQLVQLGAIEDNKISKLGQLVNEIPVSNTMSAIAIVYAKIYNCSHEMLRIVSVMDACKHNLSDLFIMPSSSHKGQDNPKAKQRMAALTDKFNNARKKFVHNSGDHMSILKIYDKFMEVNNKYKDDRQKLNDWLYEHFLKLNTLIKARDYHRKLKSRMHNILNADLTSKSLEIKHYDEIAKLSIDDRILCCLILGYRTNIANKSSRDDSYATQYSKHMKIKLSRMSFFGIKNSMPSNVIYNELFISMGKNELNIVSKIPKNIKKILSDYNIL